MPVDAYCKGCEYLTRISTGLCCGYSDAVKHVRGCKAGTGCTQKKPLDGKKPRRSISFGNPNPNKTLTPKPKAAPKTPRKITEEKSKAEYERERQQKAAEQYRNIAKGRQRAVILEYKNLHKLSNRALSEKLGVSESRAAKWVSEYIAADWDLLATIGIQRPEGL